MASTIPADVSAKKDKKEKKDKKRSETEGVHKSKKDKKDKKEKRDKLEQRLSAALDEKLQADVAASAAENDDMPGAEAEPMKVDAAGLPVVGALVPFAVPLADEKQMKKVMKSIRKAAKNNTLKRGVKEVVKALRKSPPAAPGNQAIPGVVIIAGDISPMDVISHLPVLCEDHNSPYIFVTSRAELGAAARTKRPTSVVMVTDKRADAGKAKSDAAAKKSKADDAEDDDGEDFADVYAALVKLVQKETARQGFW